MILCAAIKLYVGEEIIVPCRRHREGHEMLRKLCTHIPSFFLDAAVDGFIDTAGQFYTREEAYHHAIMCGQLSDTAQRSITRDMLFSEDLY